MNVTLVPCAMRHVAFVCVVMLSAACGLPPVARPGHTLRPGEFQFGGFVGGTFGSEKLPDATVEVSANVGLHGGAGVVDGCDASAEVSMLRLGAHARCSVLSEHRGAAVSVTPGVGVAWLPMRGPEVLASLDVGTGKDWTVAPLLNLEMSRGTYFHFVPKDPSEDGSSEESRFTRLTREETRLRSTFGFGVRARPREEDPSVAVAFGVSPYWLLAGGEAPVTTRPNGVTWSLSVGGVVD